MVTINFLFVLSQSPFLSTALVTVSSKLIVVALLATVITWLVVPKPKSTSNPPPTDDSNPPASPLSPLVPYRFIIDKLDSAAFNVEELKVLVLPMSKVNSTSI